MLSSPTNILSLFFLLPIIALIPDMTLKYFKQLYFPDKSDIQIAREKIKAPVNCSSTSSARRNVTQIKISSARRVDNTSRISL